jgi:hypothetical protein
MFESYFLCFIFYFFIYDKQKTIFNLIQTENSNKFPKTRFCKEKLVEDVVTLGPMAHATLM